MKEWVYDNNTINPLSEKEYHYTFNDEFNESIEGYNLSTSKQIAIYHANSAPPQNFTWFNVNKYFLRTKREYIDYIIEREFKSGGTIETRTDFFYDGANKLLKSSETSTNSLGETLQTEYKYPQDGVHWQTDIMNQMVQKNMISTPVIVKTSNNGAALTEQMTEYQIVNTNQILPQYVFTKKGAAAFEKNITYNSYDDKGNLTQYTLADGTPVSIIWGYNKQYPIAKVEGVAYSALLSYVTTLQTASNGGTLTATSFDALRTAMNTTANNALVTSYVYKPLVGVTEIISPNGQKETYEYDTFGRLMHVKDHQGNILKKTDYHYKN